MLKLLLPVVRMCVLCQESILLLAALPGQKDSGLVDLPVGFLILIVINTLSFPCESVRSGPFTPRFLNLNALSSNDKGFSLLETPIPQPKG